MKKLAEHGNSIGMKFTLIPAGEFMMGAEWEEFDWGNPVHKVKINNSFYLGTYPVTQREWNAVMGSNPSHFKGDDLPVEQVSWDDVQEFIRKLNEKEGTDKYRLPSEAEWEYACRAGTTARYSFGDSESELGDYAWYLDNAGSKTHPVGKKKPNPYGLYDMHGNIEEWVQDTRHDDYNGAPADGSAWESGGGADRVHRGGSWYSFSALLCWSANRFDCEPGARYNTLGFRLLEEILQLNGIVDTMNNQTLSPEEQEKLNAWMVQIEAGEMAQVQDMIENCNITFSFAKTHSAFVKDWEKSKQKLENDLKNGNAPSDMSTNFFRASIDATDEIMQRKQEKVRDAFQEKFGESIYNYIGADGKTENIGSLIRGFIHIFTQRR